MSIPRSTSGSSKKSRNQIKENRPNHNYEFDIGKNEFTTFESCREQLVDTKRSSIFSGPERVPMNRGSRISTNPTQLTYSTPSRPSLHQIRTPTSRQNRVANGSLTQTSRGGEINSRIPPTTGESKYNSEHELTSFFLDALKTPSSKTPVNLVTPNSRSRGLTTPISKGLTTTPSRGTKKTPFGTTNTGPHLRISSGIGLGGEIRSLLREDKIKTCQKVDSFDDDLEHPAFSTPSIQHRVPSLATIKQYQYDESINESEEEDLPLNQVTSLRTLLWDEEPPKSNSTVSEHDKPDNTKPNKEELGQKKDIMDEFEKLQQQFDKMLSLMEQGEL